MYNLAIISGDGIGQEVMSACEYKRVLNVSTAMEQHYLKRQSK